MPKKKRVILSLVGARPQFIKIASLAGVLSRIVHHIIVHSGQHYDPTMSDIFFDQLKIPKANHNLLVGSGSHAEMTGKIMVRLERQLIKSRPDMILVYGDTNSALAGALTAAKLRIPVGHIEAGLRSYNLDMPEEINRLLTDHISTLLFCPTVQSIKNLQREGIINRVVHSGDLMYELIASYEKEIAANKNILAQLSLKKRNYILFTLHRAGNVDDKETLEKSVDIVRRLSIPVIFPVHPRTMKNLKKFKLNKNLDKSPHIKLIKPLSYLDNLALIKNAYAVITDSGGMQKEAVFLGTPCLTLREETEWTETLGWGNKLVGLSYSRVIKTLNNLIRQKKHISCKIANRKPSEIISSAILDFFGDS